jgi:phenylacetate-CoA ligase
MESQWLSQDELLALQTKKLRPLIEHAYHNVPYYRQVFDDLNLSPEDIRKPADLQRLPLLSKQDVRQNLGRLVAQNVDRSTVNSRATSGSTGTPLPVFQTDENDRTERALISRMRGWAGWQPGERRATFSGYIIVPLDRRELPLWRHDWPERRLLFSVFHMTRDNIGRYLEELRAFRPKIIEGYPSYLSFLAKHLEIKGETLPLQAVFTFSETLYPHQRRLIEERFECKIFDWYGLTEKVASAVQCEKTDGYHVNAEKVIVEIIKPDGEPAAPGEPGEIVGTNLDEYSMPLIRYCTGDMSAYRGEPCPCGRELPLIEQIQTRVDDIITAPDGRLINPAPLAGLFRQDTIEKARIIQETRDQIVVKLVTCEGYAESDSEPILRGIHEILGSEVNISLELVDDIPCTPSGKYPFVVSKVPLEV